MTRTLAFAVDAALVNVIAAAVGAIVALVFSILPVSHDLRTVVAAVGGVVFVLWCIGYFTTFWVTTGETPGNRLLRIRVVRADGSRMKPRHAVVRLIGIVISLPLFWGYVPILYDDHRRAAYDRMAGTEVITS